MPNLGAVCDCTYYNPAFSWTGIIPLVSRACMGESPFAKIPSLILRVQMGLWERRKLHDSEDQTLLVGVLDVSEW